jgi:hypothetical protein
MDDVEAFVRELIQKENEALFAKYGDPTPIFVSKLKAANALFSEKMTTMSGISRSSKANLDVLRGQRESLIPRPVYRISEYLHPTLKTIYAAYLGEPIVESPKVPRVIYYFRRTDDGFRVIGSRMRCMDCDGRGCAHCNKTGWIHADGPDLSDPGKLVCTRESAQEQ